MVLPLPTAAILMARDVSKVPHQFVHATVVNMERAQCGQNYMGGARNCDAILIHLSALNGPIRSFVM